MSIGSGLDTQTYYRSPISNKLLTVYGSSVIGIGLTIDECVDDAYQYVMKLKK